ncbi:MAG: hypothetical protein JCHSAcid_01960 [uncultured Acidilobus sp. JCHS]|nr:MAG: hypothetical protein JCHSAcid_01960 [uncultured Acidilobus sp. JCHS]
MAKKKKEQTQQAQKK